MLLCLSSWRWRPPTDGLQQFEHLTRDIAFQAPDDFQFAAPFRDALGHIRLRHGIGAQAHEGNDPEGSGATRTPAQLPCRRVTRPLLRPSSILVSFADDGENCGGTVDPNTQVTKSPENRRTDSGRYHRANGLRISRLLGNERTILRLFGS